MFNKLVLASFCALGATAAGAQSLGTASLGVIGTIRPSTCSVSLGNGGVADLGIIGSSTVKSWAIANNPTRYYQNEGKAVPITITCPSATKFAMSFIDNRAGNVDSSVNFHHFGLGTYTVAGGEVMNIGPYWIDYQNLKVRSTVTGALNSPGRSFVTTGVANPSSTFRPTAGTEGVAIYPADSLAFSANGSATAPEALVEVSGNLIFNVQPLKATVDAATTDIVFNGSATLTLVGI